MSVCLSEELNVRTLKKVREERNNDVVLNDSKRQKFIIYRRIEGVGVVRGKRLYGDGSSVRLKVANIRSNSILNEGTKFRSKPTSTDRETYPRFFCVIHPTISFYVRRT